MDCWWSICCAFFSSASFLPFTIFFFFILCFYISDWTLPLFLFSFVFAIPCLFMWLSPWPSFFSFSCLIFFYCMLWLFPFCLFLESCLFILYIMRLVSWCSWLSHHFYVVRVPGSNPGGTIYCSPSPTCRDQYRAGMLINFSKKQRREVSINRPASYEPAALPLRHPALTINKIRRIKGQGIKGKYIIHKNILRYYIGRKYKGRIYLRRRIEKWYKWYK